MISEDFDVLAHFLKLLPFILLLPLALKLAQKSLDSRNYLLVAACKSENNHPK